MLGSAGAQRQPPAVPSFRLSPFSSVALRGSGALASVERQALTAVMKDPDFPLLNRTIQSQYPPGSVFKMVLTAAGLQEGTLSPADRVHCQGEFPFGGRVFRDWKKEGHGSVDLMGAVAQSCDIFFYGAGLKVGAPAIEVYRNAFDA